jgi:hypothetical protein
MTLANLIEVSVEEIKTNLDFLLTLLERGHTIKIIQEGKQSIIMSPLPEFVNKYEQEELPDIPMPADWKPDPVGVQTYVTETLGEMQKELDDGHQDAL